MKLIEIKPNPENPRVIKDVNFEKLCESIKSFPKMMELRPIVIDESNIILGGNMRLRALQYLKFKEIPDKWVKKSNELTEKEKKEFIIKDNVGFGEWNWDELSNVWEVEELKSWGLNIPNFDSFEQKDLSENSDIEFKIEVECENEQNQEIVYNKLIKDGYTCRILTL
jgi:ParB-like chromosome segregation protein Spo0J